MENLKNLSKGMIFYSSALSAFERLDFRSDALAGVRANYFNSDNQTQSDETEITIQNEIYKLSYRMSENQTLSWKVTKNQRPYQSVKRETGGIYCVKYYGENGCVYKRQYFDINHLWIKTEYFDKQVEGELICTISPKNIEDITIIEKILFNNNTIANIELLFPSKNPPEKISDALVYTNYGMIWYDRSFRPENFTMVTEIPATNNTFGISESAFDKSHQPENKLDFSTLEYLEETEIESELKVSDDTQKAITDISKDNSEDNPTESGENTYSAYDRIEKILREANKTNKNLFGEILEYTNPENTIEDTENIQDQVSEHLIDQILSEVSEMDKQSVEDIETNNTEVKTTSNYPKHFAADENTYDIEYDDDVNIESADDEEAYFAEISLRKEIEGFEKTEAYEIKKKQISEFLVETQTGVYSYFGNTDENGKRTGRGRTESPDGYTAYDGEYNNDKRDGFGVFYYKNGDINYVGEWSQNKRNGCGVGYRTSDGTMHIGKWFDNKPEEIGARFDKTGEFLDVANYVDGIKHGKCISVDENGNFVISLWKNGEKISERILNDIFE